MQNHIEIQSQGLTLRGYLHIPDNLSSKIPLVCFFHGFTGNKMESHYQFVRLSRELEKNNIASLRMDFAHSGESDGSFENMRPSGEIEDAKNILKYALKLDTIDKNRVGLLGFSMGGFIAGIVASEMREYIKTLCLIAPAGNLEDIFSTLFEDSDNIVDVDGLHFSKEAYEDVKSINPYDQAKDFDGNVLIVHGTEDEAVPIEYGRKYTEIYGEKSKFHSILNADHVFAKKEWENELVDTIIEFLKQNL